MRYVEMDTEGCGIENGIDALGVEIAVAKICFQ